MKTYEPLTPPEIQRDGKLADCRSGRGVDEYVLRAAGLGKALGSS
jgi:hypothetical protein